MGVYFTKIIIEDTRDDNNGALDFYLHKTIFWFFPLHFSVKNDSIFLDIFNNRINLFFYIRGEYHE